MRSCMKQPNPDRFVVTLGIPICIRDLFEALARQVMFMPTHHRTLCGSITPRLVVARENTKMTASDKFLVIQAQNWVVRVQKIGVEHNLDAIST